MIRRTLGLDEPLRYGDLIMEWDGITPCGDGEVTGFEQHDDSNTTAKLRTSYKTKYGNCIIVRIEKTPNEEWFEELRRQK
jgi:hypothetical protein